MRGRGRMTPRSLCACWRFFSSSHSCPVVVVVVVVVGDSLAPGSRNAIHTSLGYYHTKVPSWEYGVLAPESQAKLSRDLQ